MKGFLADENIPLATIRMLRQAGYVVVSIREEYRGVDDISILGLAERDRLVVITNDRDFSELIYKDKIPFTSGLVFCRLHTEMPETSAKLILHYLKESEVFVGKFSVLTPEKLRQRDL